MSVTWPSEHIRPRTDSGEERNEVGIREEVRTHDPAGVHWSSGRGEYTSLAGPSSRGGSTLMARFSLRNVTRKMLPANYRRPQYPGKTTYR
jgi:hypothetical protein